MDGRRRRIHLLVIVAKEGVRDGGWGAHGAYGRRVVPTADAKASADKVSATSSLGWFE